jgi:citronellol/citronellal dehydrogenase
MLSPPLDMAQRWFEGHTAYTAAKYTMSMCDGPPTGGGAEGGGCFAAVRHARLLPTARPRRCVLGFAGEWRDRGIGVNALWPRTAIATSAVNNLLGGETVMRRCRTPQIVADAAVAIACADPALVTGCFWIDEDVVRAVGVAAGGRGLTSADLRRYAVDGGVGEGGLVEDFFVPPRARL